MKCSSCQYPLHVSHLGVTICFHCGHIGQVVASPKLTPALQTVTKSKRSRMGSLLHHYKQLPHSMATLGLIIISLISLSLAITYRLTTTTASGPAPVITTQGPVITKPAEPTKPATVAPVSKPTATQSPKPQKAAALPAASPNPIVSYGICQADASQAMDELTRATEMVKVCDTVIPQIVARLSPSPCTPPYHIILDHNQYAAYALSCTVHVSIDWLHNSPYDPGVIPHELTHTIQGYGSIAPSWITEGIATYMSYKLNYSIGIAHCNSDETYSSGYGCGASLFNYVERVYRPSIIKDVHNSIKANTYSDSLFPAETGGRSINQLYNECLQAECKGGKSL